MLERALGKIRDGLLSISYPSQCRVCSEMIDSWEDGVACRQCWDDPSITTFLFDKPVCNKCGAHLQKPVVDNLCNRCESLEYASARACGLYNGALEASILFLKTQPHICRRLRWLITKTFSDNSETLACDVVMPIPLHVERRRERGFNQSELIARVISSRFGITLDAGSLTRIRHTERHRAGMDAIDRARSVKKAFEVARPRLVSGASILLVDDVYTTGSTTVEAVKTLLEADARQVSILTIARVSDNPV